MVETVTLNRFRDGMNGMRPDSFSYEALEVLFDWYEQLEDADIGNQIEFDPIAICGEWSEYDSAKKAANDMGSSDVDEDDFDIEDYDGDEEARQEDLEDAYKEELEKQTTILEVGDGGVLVMSY